DAGEVTGADLVEEELEQSGVGGLVGGARDDGDLGRPDRLDGLGDRGVAPAEQACAEVDDVHDSVRRCPGQLLDDELGGRPRARARLGVADDGDRAHRSTFAGASASRLATSSRTSGITY